MSQNMANGAETYSEETEYANTQTREKAEEVVCISKGICSGTKLADALRGGSSVKGSLQNTQQGITGKEIYQ